MRGQPLFDRVVEVAVGQAGTVGLAWRDLDVSFKVKKSVKKKPNAGKIQVWNLNANSRSLIEQDNMVVVLKAGYGEAPPATVIVGDISDVTHEKVDGTSYVTTIECGDGEKAYQLAHVNVSMSPGTTNLQILQAVVAAMGLPLGFVASMVPISYTQGYTATGMARDVLDDLCVSAGASWSIQDGELQVVNDDAGTNRAGVVVTPDTGLVGSPKKRKTKGRKSAKKTGVKFIMLMNPLIRPGDYILLVSAFMTGWYLVKSATHSGKTGGQFYTTVEANEVTVPVPTAEALLAPGVAAVTEWWRSLQEFVG